jgi:1,2-diacylglycerol 3-alpha-glucosyltransferase
VGNKTLVDYLMNYIIDFYKQADYVWVPNRSTGVTLKEYGFNGNYEIMPNGTDIKIPEKSEYMKMRENGLEEISTKDHDFVLLFVGQHRWEKNVKTIIEALRIIKSRGGSFKMVFVGEGYAAEDMKKLVKKYELTNDVVFKGVITERNKLINIYACSDLFVFPSVYDNAPLVMREAAAFDVPSILIRNSSAAEGVLDNANGFLINNTPEELALKIIELKQNPEAISKAGGGARKTFYRHWESIVDEAAVRYEEIIRNYAVKKK